MSASLRLTSRRIISTMTLLLIVLIDGAIKVEAPGSLAHPMPTNVGPSSWVRMPLSFGLIMSGVRQGCTRASADRSQFAGHAVMPSLARDMISAAAHRLASADALQTLGRSIA